MTNIMINVMTAWKKVHSHSGQLSFFSLPRRLQWRLFCKQQIRSHEPETPSGPWDAVTSSHFQQQFQFQDRKGYLGYTDFVAACLFQIHHTFDEPRQHSLPDAMPVSSELRCAGRPGGWRFWRLGSRQEWTLEGANFRSRSIHPIQSNPIRSNPIQSIHPSIYLPIHLPI